MASRVIVVGAGVFGSALSRVLAQRGWDVTLIEQYTPGHARASSGGDTRLVRLAHGSDDLLTRWVWDSLLEWRRLATATDHAFLEETGLVWIVSDDGAWEERSLATLGSIGVGAERREADEVREFFPGATESNISWLLYEPEAVVLRAKAAVQALVRDGIRSGVRLRGGRAVPDGAGLRLDGEQIGADRIVWACGPWLKSLFPEHAIMKVTRQDELFFGPPAGELWKSPPMPGWIDFARGAYGHGDIDGFGVKCGADIAGEEIDPDSVQRLPEEARVDHARRIMGERFPALAAAPVVGTRTCQYSLTPDSNFIGAAVPSTEERHWIMGGGSGQAFKHAPAFASHMGDVIEGKSQPIPRFAIGPREPVLGGEIRTAGTREHSPG